MSTLSTLIKTERVRQHLSQADLAFSLGTSSAYISMLENGKIDPRWSTVQRVLDRLNIKLIPSGYLFNL